MHLRREELYDVSDILQAHAFHYSGPQREEIIATFVDYIRDRNNSTARAWDAYSILKQVFAETPVATRTLLMREFFQRGRSDMGCHVFGHMRQHFKPEWRPTADTYVECLTGIARLADTNGLEMVHNMLKLDSSIEPSTRLHNALMLAYTAADMPYRALEYWQDIVRSREGPSYASLIIAMGACGKVEDGTRKAREIWKRLMNMKVEVTEGVAAAYVGALAGQNDLEEAVKVIESLEGDMGLKPGPLTYVYVSLIFRSLSFDSVMLTTLG
jgi:ubiquitin-like modifier-activating enzyme ATG7